MNTNEKQNSKPPLTPETYGIYLAEIRRASSIRRASAWANIPERVLGLPLRQMTPASHSLLTGTENAFLCGGTPAAGDIDRFVLFHWPLFNYDRPKLSMRLLKRWALRRLAGKLVPRKTKRMIRPEILAVNTVRASGDIMQIVAGTFADTLPGDPMDNPIAATLEAQLVDLFSREYPTWTQGEIRSTPIRKLNQLIRCIDRQKNGKAARYFDRDETALDRELLKAVN